MTNFSPSNKTKQTNPPFPGLCRSKNNVRDQSIVGLSRLWWITTHPLVAIICLELFGLLFLPPTDYSLRRQWVSPPSSSIIFPIPVQLLTQSRYIIFVEWLKGGSFSPVRGFGALSNDDRRSKFSHSHLSWMASAHLTQWRIWLMKWAWCVSS